MMSGICKYCSGAGFLKCTWCNGRGREAAGEIIYSHRVDGTAYQVVRTEDGHLETRRTSPSYIRGVVDKANCRDWIAAGIYFEGADGYSLIYEDENGLHPLDIPTE